MFFFTSLGPANFHNHKEQTLLSNPQKVDSETSIAQSKAQSTFSHSSLTITIDNIAEVVENVFGNLIPHFFNVSPWFLSRTVNLRIFSTITSSIKLLKPLCVIKALKQNEFKNREPLSIRLHKFYLKISLFSLRPTNPCHLINKQINAINKDFRKKIKYITNLPNYQKFIVSISVISPIIEYADYIGLLPQNVSSRLTVDSLLLTTTFFGGGSALISGVRHINKSYNKTIGMNKRTSHIVFGLIITSLGVASLYSVASTIYKLSAGLPIFYGLDATQQEGIIKHRALHTLISKKTCNAVIIDGLSSKWGEYHDNLSLPSSELIYEKCNVRYYRATKKSFCGLLKQASKELGNIDLLSINGHADSYAQVISQNYILYGYSPEWRCIDKNLAKNAQIFLMGCNTATLDNSISQTGSRYLFGKKEVTGFASLYNPFLSLNSYVNGRFKFESLTPVKETKDGKIALTTPFSSRSFIKGKEIQKLNYKKPL